jgi:hypothetical protein
MSVRYPYNVDNELRTPVAELKTLSEVAMKWPDDVTLSRDSIGDAYAIACQMERLVTQMLALARGSRSARGR